MARGFDTLAAAKRLSDAGIDRAHAEAIAEAAAGAQGGLAAKDDLRVAVAELRAAMTDLERRTMPVGIALAGALFAAIRYL